jgi:hypothetical protein
MAIKNILGELDASITPTKKGFTPLGFLVVASAASLVLFGAVRVGVCVQAGSGSCETEWEALRTDTRTAGLGLVGLAAQSPWAKAAHLVLGGAKEAARPAPTRRRAPAAPKVKPTTTPRKRRGSA